MVYIVGLGPGNRDYILKKAIDTLEKSDVIIGFKRLISNLDFVNKKKLVMSSLKETLEYIKEHGEDKVISLVASGDPTFFGIGEYIKRNYPGNVEIVPGISSFQYLTCKLNKSWSISFTGSVHGRSEKFLDKVKENKLSIWLTDNKNNATNLCRILSDNNIKCKVVIGEYLSYENERILYGNPSEFIKDEFSDVAILVVENEI